MRVRLMHDLTGFAEVAAGFISSDPLTTSVIATNVGGILYRSRPMQPDSAWIVVEEDEAVVGIAMHTPPWPVFLPRLGDGVPAAVAEELWRRERPLPGVTGEAGSVALFTERWVALTGASWRTRTAMRMYVLGELRPPGGVEGRGRLGTEHDVGVVGSWLAAFHAEAIPDGPSPDPLGEAARRIRHGELWLWEHDGEVVALAGVSPPASGVARVGPVYTPPDRRRRGYGAAVTAAASRAAMEAGSTHVILYTDLSNPVANSIYQPIGYLADHDAEERDFVATGR